MLPVCQRMTLLNRTISPLALTVTFIVLVSIITSHYLDKIEKTIGRKGTEEIDFTRKFWNGSGKTNNDNDMKKVIRN